MIRISAGCPWHFVDWAANTMQKSPTGGLIFQHVFGLKIRAVYHGENYPLGYQYAE
ncbi:hypothetical protein [Klebsiella quasipneumoniae]|uniref:hypothetical protein n=1 Tax=Klebsiella quasipneumoniae TaxID=1463165 RepID=UPI0015C5FA2D|nr:hypothetical protein [Klebsiella quasipneumoniae]MCJ7364717.1 hypothetical protein [Klebsiella quasipneumoniae]